MTGSDPQSRARDALDSLQALSASDTTRALDAARRLREAAEEIEQAAAADARWVGATWTEIGALYGTSKQGAQQRFGRNLPKRPRPVRSAPASTGPDL